MPHSARPNCKTLLTELPEFFIECLGDATTEITMVRSPDQDIAGSTVFCANPKAIAAGLASQASVMVIPKQAAVDVDAKRNGKVILLSTNVERAMSAVIRGWFLETPYRDPAFTGVHPSAVLHETAKLAPDVRVGPNAVVGAHVKIGARSFIGANAVIESAVEIGEDTTIHPLVYIGHHTKIGSRCEILPNSTIGKEGFGYAHDEKGNHYRIPHQGIVVIEDGVNIGASCTIDRSTFAETRICAGTIFDNRVHIGHNCKVGRNSVVTAGFMMAGSSQVGANFLTGGGTVVTGHVKVADNVQLSALSVVGKSVEKSGQYGGDPLLPLSDHVRARAARLHLAEMRKQLTALVKKFMPELLADKKSEE